jgi:hypothetical protein
MRLTLATSVFLALLGTATVQAADLAYVPPPPPPPPPVVFVDPLAPLFTAIASIFEPPPPPPPPVVTRKY